MWPLASRPRGLVPAMGEIEIARSKPSTFTEDSGDAPNSVKRPLRT